MDDAEIQKWVLWVAMGAGAFFASLFGFRGWKQGGKVDPPKELLISGQSAITDMAPIKELLKQVDLLCLKIMAAAASIDSAAGQQKATAAALERVGDLIATYLEKRAEDIEIEKEVERRLQVRRDRAVRARAARKPSTDP
jgi:hypothetical protein